MGKFKEEIIALNATASNMSEEAFNQKVLASVAAHLAEATQQEESYYTHLAKFELVVMPKILVTSTLISSLFGSDVDPLLEVREKNALVPVKLLESLSVCVQEIKGKMEKQAVSLEKMAFEYEEMIAENKQDDSSSKIKEEHKLSTEALSTLAKSAEAIRENAKQTRNQAVLYDTYKGELESFFTSPSNVLSKEASILLGQLRRYVSATDGLPKSFADWNTMTVKALSSPKSNATVMASITSLLTAINSYQAATEKMMRDRMVERTTVNDFQQMLAHIAQKAANINDKASSTQEQLSKAQNDVALAGTRLKQLERKLQEEQENTKKREQENAHGNLTVNLTQVTSGFGTQNGNGSMLSFVTWRSKKVTKGQLESSSITDGQNMIKYAGWTQSKVALVQNLRLQYNLELYNESIGKGTRVATLATNGHTRRDFIGKGETMSAKMFSFIEALADETATPLAVAQELNAYYAGLEVAKNLASIEDTLLHDIEKQDKAPGFTVNNKTAKDTVKMIYYKISMLFNMWSDDDDVSMLPYNMKKAEKYGQMALQMEKDYPFLEKNRNEKLVELRAANK